MVSLIWKIFDVFDFIDKNGDPRVGEWFLMKSPASTIAIIIVYLYFIYKLGPKLMKDRPPLDVNKVLIVYNVIQVFMAGYIIKEACRVLWFTGNYNFFCIEINDNFDLGKEQARLVWIYLMTKLLDLLDTVFFVLRKKQSQVTFLHVYHHTMVFGFGWFITKYYPGGQIAFFGTVNAFVHMVMYSYYLVTALHIVNGETLWWKKYVTQLQLVQFVLTGIHGMVGLFVSNCTFPKYLMVIGIVQDIFIFIMFWKFYQKTYLFKSKIILPSGKADSSNDSINLKKTN